MRNKLDHQKGRDNLKVLFCYETNCSGETIATENIIKEFGKTKKIKVYSSSSRPIQKIDLFSYFGWILESVLYWIKIISRHNKIDWIYTTTFTAGIAAALFKHLRGFKIVLHYHGSRLPKYSKSLPLKVAISQLIKLTFTLLLHNIFIRSTDVIFVPSNFTKSQIKKQFRGLKNKKIITIPNGVNSYFFRETPEARQKKLLQKYSITRGTKVVTYIGLLDKRKNVELIIKAFDYISKKLKALLFIIHFNPRNPLEHSYKKKLMSLMKGLNLNEKCFWIRNPKNIKIFYNISGVIVLPSKEDHFPLVFLESLATKTLFISTPTGAIKNLLPKVDGRLVIRNKNPQKLAGQILGVINLPEDDKKNILKKGFDLAKEFSWNKTSKIIYRNLIRYS